MTWWIMGMGYFDTMPYNTYLSFSYNIGLYEWYRKDLSTGWTSHLRWNVKYTCWNHRQPWSSLEYIPIEIHAGKSTHKIHIIGNHEAAECLVFPEYLLCPVFVLSMPDKHCAIPEHVLLRAGWESKFFWHLPELGTPMRVIFIAYLAWLLKGITVQYFYQYFG